MRYSITNPHQYISNNIVAFHNILFASKEINVKHFIYASTSSVYGDVSKFPLKETENTDKPLSIYAASKSPTKF